MDPDLFAPQNLDARAARTAYNFLPGTTWPSPKRYRCRVLLSRRVKTASGLLGPRAFYLPLSIAMNKLLSDSASVGWAKMPSRSAV